jgi:hypothetical protein
MARKAKTAQITHTQLKKAAKELENAAKHGAKERACTERAKELLSNNFGKKGKK